MGNTSPPGVGGLLLLTLPRIYFSRKGRTRCCRPITASLAGASFYRSLFGIGPTAGLDLKSPREEGGGSSDELPSILL